MKIENKGLKLLILTDAVVYVGLFFIKEFLKWFKFYFSEFQINGLMITN